MSLAVTILLFVVAALVLVAALLYVGFRVAVWWFIEYVPRELTGRKGK